MGNLKTLWLALVAVLAMGIVATSGAQASEFTATKTPAVITGSQEGSENYIRVPNAGGVKVECPGPAYDGTMTSKSTSSLTITPTFEKGGKCTTSFGTGATFDMNGCDYLFRTSIGSGDNWSGSAEIVCPAGKQIQITTGICTIDIPPQTLIGVEYQDITNANPSQEDITVIVNTLFNATATNVLFCPFSGLQTGAYVTKFTLMGFEDIAGGEGAQVGLLVD